MVCNCPLGALDLGFPRCCRSISAPTCVLPKPSFLSIKQCEMAATCAGLRDFQVKPSYETRLATSSNQPGAH